MQIDRRGFVASVLAMGLGISDLKASRASDAVLSKEYSSRYSWHWRFHSPDGKPVRIPNQRCHFTDLQVELDGDGATMMECKIESSEGALVRVPIGGGGCFRWYSAPECRPVLVDEALFITTSMQCAFSGTASFCSLAKPELRPGTIAHVWQVPDALRCWQWRLCDRTTHV